MEKRMSLCLHFFLNYPIFEVFFFGMYKCICMCIYYAKVNKWKKCWHIYIHSMLWEFSENRPKLALPTLISNQVAIFWKERRLICTGRFSECYVITFPCFRSLQFRALLNNHHLHAETCQKKMPPNMSASRALPNNPKQNITTNSHLSQSNVEDSNATIFTRSTSGPAAHVMINTYHCHDFYHLSYSIPQKTTSQHMATKVIHGNTSIGNTQAWKCTGRRPCKKKMRPAPLVRACADSKFRRVTDALVALREGHRPDEVPETYLHCGRSEKE